MVPVRPAPSRRKSVRFVMAASDGTGPTKPVRLRRSDVSLTNDARLGGIVLPDMFVPLIANCVSDVGTRGNAPKS